MGTGEYVSRSTRFQTRDHARTLFPDTPIPRCLRRLMDLVPCPTTLAGFRAASDAPAVTHDNVMRQGSHGPWSSTLGNGMVSS